MSFHDRMTQQRNGLMASTSPLAYSNHTFGILESLILYTVTALAPGLSNALIAGITTALTSLATTAIVTGLQYLLMPKPPKPADGKAPKKQAVPPVIFGVGTNRVGGFDMLWEEAGGVLYEVMGMAGHLISAFRRIYIGDDYITVYSGSSGTISDIFLPGGATVRKTLIDDGRFVDHVQVGGRIGQVPETAYDFIVNGLGSQGIWTNSHRGDGQASLGFGFWSAGAKRQATRYPGGLPQPSAVMDMAKVCDWRDPAQIHDDPATWKFSKNAALCLVWWLCHCPYGPRWSFVRSILPVLDRWTEEADICDELVTTAIGGTEPRYEVNGWATTETDPVAILNSFLAACDGHLAQHGDGTLILTVGKFRDHLVETISDADIVGHTIQYDVQEEDEVNRLVPKFTYPETDYTTAITDYFESVADQSKVGRVLAQDADLAWVHRWRQARRLAQREWRRIQQKIGGTFDLRLSAINSVYARWIRMETPVRIPKLDGSLIENRRSTMALQQGGFQMEWKKHPADIDAWNPSTDEGAAPPVPVRPKADGLPKPLVDSISVQSIAGGVFLRISLIDPGRTDITPAIRYRLAGGTSWTTQTFDDAEPDMGLIVLDTNQVPGDVTLEYEVYYKGSKGSDGPATDTASIRTTVDSIPPAGLLSFSASDGVGTFAVNVGTENDGHLSTIAIYRVAPGAPISPRPPMAARPAVSPGISYSIPVTAPAGVWDIYAEPMNQSGIAGPLSGPAPVTVT